MNNKSLFALLALVGLAFGAPSPEEPDTRAASTFQNCDCQCDSYTWSSKGKILGNCHSPDATNANFCYISGIAVKACRDVQVSQTRTDSFGGRGKHYSYEACSTPPRHQCRGSGGPGSNFGDGDRGAGFGGPGQFGGPGVGHGGPGIGGAIIGGPPVGGPGGRPPISNLASILGVRTAGDAEGETGDEAVQA